MKLSFLSKTDKEVTGADVAIMFDYADVAAVASGVAINALSVLAGTRVKCLGYKMATAFDVTGTGALAVTVGDGGAANSLMASSVIAVDGTEIFYHVGGSEKVYLVDDTVDVFFTDATSMAYTAGKITFYLAVSDMNEWAKVV
jgi:hypothetical protein